MRYRKLSEPGALGPLDPGGDYRFGGGKADWWINQPDGVAQAVATRLRLYRGDWWLDRAQGTDWRGRVLGSNTRAVHDLELRGRILGTIGAAGLPVYRSTLNGETRRLDVQATVDTIYGQAALAAAVFVAAPTVTADQIPVSLLGYNADLLFGLGGDTLVGKLAPPKVHDGEAGRIPYGAALDEFGFLTDGDGNALIAALGFMPFEPSPSDALADGFGGLLIDGFGNVLVSGTGVPEVPLPPTAASLPLELRGDAASTPVADLHRPQLAALAVAGSAQSAAVHRPQLATGSGAATTQAAVLHRLAFAASATAGQSAVPVAIRGLAAPATAGASASVTAGIVVAPAHALIGAGVATAGAGATLHAWRHLTALGEAAGLSAAAMTSVHHLGAHTTAATRQTTVLSI